MRGSLLHWKEWRLNKFYQNNNPIVEDNTTGFGLIHIIAGRTANKYEK